MDVITVTLQSKYAYIPYSVQFSWGKIFMVFVVGGLTTNILPTNEATLPTFTCSASSNHENITHEN